MKSIARHTDTSDPADLIHSAQVYAKAAETTMDIDYRASQTCAELSTACATLALALTAQKEAKHRGY